MKPLFVNGNFNEEGKRIRVNYVKTVGEYPLWVEDGKPNKTYTRIENNKYYLYIQHGEWIFNCGYTEYDLIQYAGEDYLNKKWYGNYEGRGKYFNDNFYKGRNMKEAHELVKEQIEKEKEFINQWGNNDNIQYEFLKEQIDVHIQNYIDARDNNGAFPDFIGATFLNELDKCKELAKIRMAKLEEKERIKKAEIAEQKIKEAEEAKIKEQKEIEDAESAFVYGGTVKGGRIILKLAEKYGIDVPLRTKGWIIQNLIESMISDKGSISYRRWKRKGSTGSTKISSVLHDVRDRIIATKALKVENITKKR